MAATVWFPLPLTVFWPEIVTWPQSSYKGGWEVCGSTWTVWSVTMSSTLVWENLRNCGPAVHCWFCHGLVNLLLGTAFQILIPVPRFRTPVVTSLPWYCTLGLRNSSPATERQFVSLGFYSPLLLYLLPTPLCSTWCQIPCCIRTTCLSGPLPSAAFVSQPLSGCLLTEPYLCFSLVVAILHNLIYSGLTHPIIIQDLVLTGKNIKKKKRRYIQGKQKREAKWCNEWALHLEWSSSLNSATSYLHDLSQVTKPFGNFGFLIDHMKEVDQMVIQIPSSPGILRFYMQVRKLLKVSWTLLRVRNKKAGA